MVKDVNQRDEVKIIGRIVGFLEELTGYYSPLDGLGEGSRRRDGLDAVEFLEAITLSCLEHEPHVAADVEYALAMAQMRRRQPIVERHRAPDIVLLARTHVGFG